MNGNYYNKTKSDFNISSSQQKPNNVESIFNNADHQRIKNHFMEYYQNKRQTNIHPNFEKSRQFPNNMHYIIKKCLTKQDIKKQKCQNICSVMTQQFQQAYKNPQIPTKSLIIKIPTRNPITKKSQKTYNQTKSQSYPVQKILKISPKLKKQYVDYKKYEQIIESYHDFDQLQIKEVLGAGSNAVVKLASDNQQNYAIKIYEKYKLMNPNKLKIVYKEINLLKKIQHPNIPYLYNAYEDKKQIHIIMQYVEGITLYQYFKNNKFTLQIQIIKHIIKQLVNAISYLHQIDICHRDIKLQNILINTKTQQIKLIDFGYATYHNLKSVLQCGTPSYMAPQLFQKNCMYDPKKVDVWAIGILIYYLVLHFLPFKGYDQKDLIRRIKSNDYSIKIIDIKLMSLMNQLLEQDPMKRIDCNKILDCEWFK